MSIPYERSRAVLQTRVLLNELAAGAHIDKDRLRRRAAALLRHYPGPVDINNAAALLPTVWAKADAKRDD